MKTLNATPADVLRTVEPHAVTDVTGFGLIGHAYELATRSGVRIELDARLLPIIPAAIEPAGLGAVTGGDRRNREYVGDALTVDGASDIHLNLGFDPQTAGGLLAAIPLDRALAFEQACIDRNILPNRIGSVSEGAGVRLFA
jgi:Selenophosphate synthase